MQIALYILIGIVVGACAVGVIVKFLANNALNRSRAEAEQIKNNALSEAQNKSKEIELAARQEQIKRKEQSDRELEQKRNELKTLEGRLSKREDTLDRKLDTLSVKEKHLDELEARLSQRDKALAGKEEQLSQILHEQRDRLLQLTNLSPEQAKEMLLKRIEDDCKLEAGALIQRITEHAQDEAKEKAAQHRSPQRGHLGPARQRIAAHPAPASLSASRVRRSSRRPRDRASSTARGSATSTTRRLPRVTAV